MGHHAAVGEQAAERLYQTLVPFVEEYESPGLTQPATPLHEIAGELLDVIPDDMFILAVELGEDMAVGLAFESGITIEFRNSFEMTVAERMVTNGVPYHVEEGRLVPSMSPRVISASLHPAVDVLEDERLVEARRHFPEAMRRLQGPDPDEAVDEARQTVEAAMLALLDEHGVPHPDKHQPDALFNALVAGSAMSDAS